MFAKEEFLDNACVGIRNDTKCHFKHRGGHSRPTSLDQSPSRVYQSGGTCFDVGVRSGDPIPII